MEKDTTVFIGAGRIALILVGAWEKAGFDLSSIHAFDRDPRAAAELAARFPGVVAHADAESLPAAGLLILAVPPPGLAEAAAAAERCLDDGTLVLSLAPKVRLDSLSSLFGGRRLLARMNPSAPALVGKGYNPWSMPEDAREAETAEAERRIAGRFDALGPHPRVADALIEAYAVVSAMGPTYLLFQLRAIAGMGVEFGLAPEEARRAVAAMAAGSGALAAAGDYSWEFIQDLVPAKPIAEAEGTITAIYREKLRGMFDKLTK